MHWVGMAFQTCIQQPQTQLKLNTLGCAEAPTYKPADFHQCGEYSSPI